MCPFGCKTDNCPYDWDAEKCPHDLDKKSVEDLSDYVLKLHYYEDDEDDYVSDNSKKSMNVDPKILKAVQDYKTPGNYT